jgi:hypothetical protein
MAMLGIAIFAVVAVALLPSPGLVLRQAQTTEASPQTRVQSELVTEQIYTNVTVVPEQAFVNVSQTFTVEVWINNVKGVARALQTGSTSLILCKTGYDRKGESLIDCEGIKIGDRDANPIASISYNGFIEVQMP